MDIIYQNNTVVTEEVLIEFIQGTFKTYNKMVRMLALWGVVIPSLLLVVIGMIIPTVGSFMPAIILASAFGIFMFLKGYVIYKNKVIKNFFSLHGQSPITKCVFYNEKLKNTSPNSELTVDYEQITDIVETKNLYILMIERQGVMLKKDGFVVGEQNQFQSFIMSKCKNIRNK